MTSRSVRIATRGSELALRQTEIVAAALGRAGCDLPIEVVIVRTSGDLASARKTVAATVGAFTREVDREVLACRADLAVHSLKDLPTALPPGLVIGAVPPREDPADVLCAKQNMTLDDLPAGSIVGAGGLRRRALLLRRRPDLVVEPVRGNVDTRLRLLDEDGQLSAIVLAAAGIHRLERAAAISQRFDPWEWLPAPGQGAIAVTRRADDERMAALVSTIDHRASHSAVRAERAFLAAVDAGCRAPVGALAAWQGDRLRLRAMLMSIDGSTVQVDEVEAPAGADEHALGCRLAGQMLGAGGRELLARARRDSRGTPHD